MIKNIFCFLVLFVLFTPVVNGQRKKKLNTNNKGTLFGQVGYNRSAYSSTDIALEGSDYSIQLKEAMVDDNLEGKPMANFFSSSSPQISAKLGFFIANKLAITASFDRYNTFFQEKQTVTLDGTFAPGSNSEFSGSYDNESTAINRNQFNIAQRSGINYFAIGVQRNDQWYKSRKATFEFQTLCGAQIGGLFTQIDYTYDGYTTQEISSLSGFGLSLNAGIRLAFIQHIYVQLEVRGGWLNQNQIKLSQSGSVMGKQVVGFFSPAISIGFNLFALSSNACGTCPQW